MEGGKVMVKGSGRDVKGEVVLVFAEGLAGRGFGRARARGPGRARARVEEGRKTWARRREWRSWRERGGIALVSGVKMRKQIEREGKDRVLA